MKSPFAAYYSPIASPNETAQILLAGHEYPHLTGTTIPNRSLLRAAGIGDNRGMNNPSLRRLVVGKRS